MFETARIDWQAVAAIATLAAVLVALFPIWRESARRKAQMRSLRLRINSRLGTLRPSLQQVITGQTPYPGAIFSKADFQAVVRAVAEMMQESSVLDVEEQDHLGVLIANLENTAVLYDTSDLHPESAKNILDLIDKCISIMSQHGLLQGRVDKPWD